MLAIMQLAFSAMLQEIFYDLSGLSIGRENAMDKGSFAVHQIELVVTA